MLSPCYVIDPCVQCLERGQVSRYLHERLMKVEFVCLFMAGFSRGCARTTVKAPVAVDESITTAFSFAHHKVDLAGGKKNR